MTHLQLHIHGSAFAVRRSVHLRQPAVCACASACCEPQPVAERERERLLTNWLTNWTALVPAAGAHAASSTHDCSGCVLEAELVPADLPRPEAGPVFFSRLIHASGPRPTRRRGPPCTNQRSAALGSTGDSRISIGICPILSGLLLVPSNRYFLAPGI